MNKNGTKNLSIPPIPLGVNPSNKEPYRVFLVEDSLPTRTFLKRILAGYGFKICGEAENGQQALDVFDKMMDFPDIICIDQNMPIMDGITTVREINKRHKRTKIVMITGNSDKNFIQQIVKVKIHAYIVKPIIPKTVAEKLANILGRKDLLENETAYKTKSIDLSKLSIPALPEVVLKVAQFDIEDLERGIKELEEIILPDAGIVSHILKVANSSYYGLSKKVTTLKDAITLLGVKTVKNIVLMNYNHGLSKNLKSSLFVKYIRKWPVLSSLIAFDLVKPLGVEELQKNIFLIVLLRKIGMNIFSINFPEQYLKTLKLYEFNLKTIYELEKDEFNITSIEIGEKVFKVWKMPDSFIEAIVHQNFSLIDLDTVSDMDRIARLSDILAKKMLEIPLSETELTLPDAIFDHYHTPVSTREIFNHEYLDMIKDHPFMSMLEG